MSASPTLRELSRRLEWDQAGLREANSQRDRIIREHYRTVAELDRQIDERYTRILATQQRMDALRAEAAVKE